MYFIVKSLKYGNQELIEIPEKFEGGSVVEAARGFAMQFAYRMDMVSKNPTLKVTLGPNDGTWSTLDIVIRKFDFDPSILGSDVDTSVEKLKRGRPKLFFNKS